MGPISSWNHSKKGATPAYYGTSASPEARFAAWAKTSTQPSPPMESTSFTPRRKATSTSFGAMGPKLTNWPRSGPIPKASPGRQTGASSGLPKTTSFGRCRRADRIFISCFPVGTLWADQCCGRWTPDGKFFLFLSGDSGSGGSQIWALDERRGLFRRPPAEPVQLTTGPLSWSRPIPGRDGKSIFAEGIVSRGRTLPLRRNGQTVPALPWRHFRPGRDLLQRRSICGLCLLPRRHPLEGKPGWKQPDAIERPADRCFHAPLVARRHPDPVLRTFLPKVKSTSSLRKAASRVSCSPKAAGNRVTRTGRPTDIRLFLVLHSEPMIQRARYTFSTSTARRSPLFPDRLA